MQINIDLATQCTNLCWLLFLSLSFCINKYLSLSLSLSIFYYTFDIIKTHTKEVNLRLKQTLQRSISLNEFIKLIKEEKKNYIYFQNRNYLQQLQANYPYTQTNQSVSWLVGQFSSSSFATIFILSLYQTKIFLLTTTLN